MTCRAIVLRENPDGSRHLVLRQSSKYGEGNDRVLVGTAELFPDGRVKQDPMEAMQLQVDQFFPKLPDDEAQLKSGWQSSGAADNSTIHYKLESESGDRVTISATKNSPIDRIYLLERKQTMRFDPTKGTIVEGESSFGQDWPSHSTGSGKMKLAKDETIDGERLATLAKDYDTFFEAKKRYNELSREVSEDPGKADSRLKDAEVVLDNALKAVSSDEVKAELTRMKDQHARYAQYELDEAKKQAEVFNKPAPDFSATDFDGKTWNLSELKGKVVVMDFWYRGCGWCMYAMPQVKQLSVDYKDKPVQFLAMNTDQKDEDAKFVVEKFGLEYPVLKAKDVAEKYNVRAFPTLIIIDQQGKVRAFDVGYSPDLHDKVAKKLDALLQTAG